MTSIKKAISSAELGDTPLIGKGANVRDSSLGYACEIGERCEVVNTVMDDYSYISRDSDIINSFVGKFCSIAAHTRINPGNHPLERAAMHHFTYRASRYGFGEDEPSFFEWRAASPVRIGHDVWVGHGAVIMAGVSIGNGAAIGAGAIVTKDVPAFSIAVGNPAKVIRKRFNDELIEKLERLAWWDWPAETLAERLVDFRALSTEQFVNKYLPEDRH